jgi:DNA-binding NtrC family response regulator
MLRVIDRAVSGEYSVWMEGDRVSQNSKTSRVFVVDDESTIATTVGLVLRSEGYEAHTFELPLEALEAARELTPDLLLSDVMMPVLSGIELAIQIRERCPNCKVLLFSGHPSTAGYLDAARAEGHDFQALAKPVHPADLLASIRTVMDS